MQCCAFASAAPIFRLPPVGSLLNEFSVAHIRFNRMRYTSGIKREGKSIGRWCRRYVGISRRDERRSHLRFHQYRTAHESPRAAQFEYSENVNPRYFFPKKAKFRFQKAYVDQNGSIRADGHNLDLYGAVLIRRDRICTSAEGARWTCGQRAYMTLRALLAQRPITCSFKPISVPPKAVCSVDNQDIAQFLLREGWASSLLM